ncbi:MAG: YceI family protein [Planctomycetota bacterium]|jgi:polyisoprenoid-binding protein YceI
MIRIAFAFLGAALLAGLSGDDVTVYHVGHNPKYVNITFESEADLETIVGTSNEARGEIRADLVNHKGSVRIVVPVASLKTGIDLRDEHLRGPYWLDAAKYPEIVFASTKVVPVKDSKNLVEVAGDFTLHGVTKRKKVVVDWRHLPEELTEKKGFPAGKWIRFRASFDVKLSEHGVEIPDMAIGKVSDVWKVKFVLFGGTAPVGKDKKE